MAYRKNYRQKIKDCLAGQNSSRHACMFFINFPFVQSVTGVDLHSYFHDPKVMMDAQVDTWRAIGTEGWLWPDLGVVPECAALGGQVVYDKRGFPSIQADEEKELEDFLNLKPADPYGDNMLAEALAALEYMVAHKPSGFEVQASIVQSAFTGAAMLRGISEFCVDLLDEPEKARELMDIVLETDIRYMKAQEQILGGLDHILLSDDISSFLSGIQFQEYVIPYYKKFFDCFPESQRWLHNDGQALHLAPFLYSSGVQLKLWHTGSCFDHIKAMESMENSLCMAGNLDPVAVAGMSEEEVYGCALRELRKFKGNTRFILGLGGFISYGTPPENIRAVLRAADDVIIKEAESYDTIISDT